MQALTFFQPVSARTRLSCRSKGKGCCGTNKFTIRAFGHLAIQALSHVQSHVHDSLPAPKEYYLTVTLAHRPQLRIPNKDKHTLAGGVSSTRYHRSTAPIMARLYTTQYHAHVWTQDVATWARETAVNAGARTEQRHNEAQAERAAKVKESLRGCRHAKTPSTSRAVFEHAAETDRPGESREIREMKGGREARDGTETNAKPARHRSRQELAAHAITTRSKASATPNHERPTTTPTGTSRGKRCVQQAYPSPSSRSWLRYYSNEVELNRDTYTHNSGG